MTKIVNCYSQQKKSAGCGRRFNLKYFNFGLLALGLTAGVFYLVTVTSLTVQGFVLRDLKSQAATLASQKAETEEKVNAIQSYYSLNSRTQGLDMVAVGNVEYIVVPHAVVARR
jgi:hypothetical protein